MTVGAQRKKTTKKVIRSQQRFTSRQIQSLCVGVVIVSSLIGLFTNIAYNHYQTQVLEPRQAFALVPSQPVYQAQANVMCKKTEEIPINESISYVVQPGDSVHKVAQKLCSGKNAWLKIIEENNLKAPYTLHAGKVLTFTCL